MTSDTNEMAVFVRRADLRINDAIKSAISQNRLEKK